ALHDEGEDVAAFAARPAAVVAVTRVNLERRPRVVVEGTQPLEEGACWTEGDVAAHHLDDVDGLFNLLDPFARQGATHVQEPGSRTRRFLIATVVAIFPAVLLR